MIDFENKTDYNIDNKLLKELNEIANKVTTKDVELIFVKEQEIKELNKTYRNTNRPTDVLSFRVEAPFVDLLGSIVICTKKAKEAATKYGHTQEEEIKLLFIHGLLHLIGYDHEKEDLMREKEKELIELFSLPKSLIIRSEDESC
jgi:probable rRNA maturation factor